MKNYIYMISDTCWGRSVLVNEGAFSDEAHANAKAKELAEADAKKENGKLEVKTNRDGETEYWNKWNHGSHVFRIIKIEVR